MKLKTCIITVLFISITTSSWSQLNTYPLADFSQPDFYRKVSFINPNANFNSSIQEVPGNNPSNFHTNSFSNYFIISISKFNRNKQSFFSFSENSSISSSKNDIALTRSLYQAINVFSEHKNFHTAEDLFTGIDLSHSSSIDFDLFKRKDLFEFQPYGKRTSIRTSNEVIFKLGKGRIESIDRAWHAIRILESICDHSDLNKNDITHDQITDFANKLGEVLNIRVTDSRLEFSKEVEVIYDYLIAKNFIRADDHHLFVHILDAYRFEQFINRSKGSELYIGIGAQFDYRSQKSDVIILVNSQNEDHKLTDINTEIGPIIKLGANHFKPLNHQWQLSFINELSLSNFKTKDYRKNTFSTSAPEEFRTNELVGNIMNNLRLDFLPSRRTNLYLQYSSQIEYENDLENDIPIEAIGITHLHTLDLNAVYYVSPWHIINVDLGIRSIRSYKNSESRNISSSVRLSTLYYFH